MATTNPKPFVSLLTTLKQTAVQQPVMLGPVAAIVGAVGKTTQVNTYNLFVMTLNMYALSVFPFGLVVGVIKIQDALNSPVSHEQRILP